MNGGFGMKNDPPRVPNLLECFLCKKIFLTPQALFSHTNTFHPNHQHYSTFSSSAAAPPVTLCLYPNLDRSPNPAFPARNRLDLNDHRSGHIDEQGRLLEESPAITLSRNTNVLFGQQEKPELMNLFPVMPSEGLSTLPLLCQLEKPIPEDTATEEGGGITSGYIDLTLRL